MNGGMENGIGNSKSNGDSNGISNGMNLESETKISQNNNQTVKKILYSIVMIEESDAILEQEKFIRDQAFCREYSNILEAFVLDKEGENGDKYQIVIVRPLKDPLHDTGLFGSEIAFMQAYSGIKHYSPDVVINLGYAGEVALEGAQRKLKHGSIVIAKEKGLYHKREMIIEYFRNTCEGHYPVMECEKLVKHLGFEHCTVGTANSFSKIDTVAIKKNIEVVEMELCSVARASYYFKTPCIGVKVISDTADNLNDEEREKQFLNAMSILKQKLHEAYTKLNTYLLGKNITEII